MLSIYNAIIPMKTYSYTKENIEKLFQNKHYSLTDFFCNLDIKYFNQCENIYTLKNKKYYKFIVFTLACMLIIDKNVYATAKQPLDDLGALTPLYKIILKYTNITAYLVFLYKAVECAVKGAIAENLSAKWKEVLSYIIGFALVRYLPKIFEAVYLME